MKNLTKPFFLAAFLFLIFSNATIAQETIYITLNVDTAEVKIEGTHNYCYFNGQAATIDTRDYTVNANVGDVIVWNAVSSSSDRDQVKITAINYEGGTNVFNSDRMNGENGEVRATISKSTAGKEDYKYNVSFKIVKNGKLQPGTFHIDPKIKVGS